MAYLQFKRPRISKEVLSGLREQVHIYHWRVHNFDYIMKNDHDIEAQSFAFEIRDEAETYSKWVISLNATENESDGKCVSLNYKLTEPRGTSVTCKCGIKVEGENSENLFTSNGVFAAIKTEGSRTFKNILSLKKLTESSLAINVLTIKVTFTILTRVPSTFSSITTEQEFNEKGVQELSVSGSLLLSDTFDDLELSDVKITAKDGEEFKCHKVILAARCAIFATMFRSKMIEVTSGEIKLDDLSGKTVKILLHYLYSGKLLQEWRKDDVIVEFTYAAGKYQLKKLLEYLDCMLGKVCTKASAQELLQLAVNLSLWKAEKELMDYIKTYTMSVSKATDLLKILGNE